MMVLLSPAGISPMPPNVPELYVTPEGVMLETVSREKSTSSLISLATVPPELVIVRETFSVISPVAQYGAVMVMGGGVYSRKGYSLCRSTLDWADTELPQFPGPHPQTAETLSDRFSHPMIFVSTEISTNSSGSMLASPGWVDELNSRGLDALSVNIIPESSVSVTTIFPTRPSPLLLTRIRQVIVSPISASGSDVSVMGVPLMYVATLVRDIAPGLTV